MGQPKRKQSKQRSRKRRHSVENTFQAPQLARDDDGTYYRPHRVNPHTGMYRGRQVLDIEA